MITVKYNPFEMILNTIQRVNEVDAELIFTSKEHCDDAWGFTQKNDDGTYTIGIAVELQLENVIEIIAHEAAHIMAKSHDKSPEEAHDEEWEFWFEMIHKEYTAEFERISRKEETDMRKELMNTVQQAVDEELTAANKKFRAFTSTHEGYAVTLEEAQETELELRKVAAGLNQIWEMTKANADKDNFEEVLEELQTRAENMAAEAIQTAAMLKKFRQFNNGRV